MRVHGACRHAQTPPPGARSRGRSAPRRRRRRRREHPLGIPALAGASSHPPGYNRVPWLCSRTSSRSCSSARAEEHVARYVIREHERGRTLDEILEDKYVQNRLTPEQQRRLLDRPEIVGAFSGETSRRRRPGQHLVGRARPAQADAAWPYSAVPTPRSPRAPQRLRPDRDIPGGDAVRLEDDDVGVRLTARDLARHDLVELVHLQPVEGPAATGSIRSPDSSRACSSESQQTKDARSRTTLSSSRRLATFAPAATTRAPGRSHSPRSTGSRELVIVTTTSCAAASRWLSPGSAPVRSQKAASRSGVRQ